MVALLRQLVSLSAVAIWLINSIVNYITGELETAKPDSASQHCEITELSPQVLG